MASSSGSCPVGQPVHGRGPARVRRNRRGAERAPRPGRPVLVDMHAEATSEKVGLGWYLDGQVTAVVGTHTHVRPPSAGASRRDHLHRRRRNDRAARRRHRRQARAGDRIDGTRMPVRFETSTEDPWLNAVLIRASSEPRRADAIERCCCPRCEGALGAPRSCRIDRLTGRARRGGESYRSRTGASVSAAPGATVPRGPRLGTFGGVGTPNVPRWIASAQQAAVVRRVGARGACRRPPGRLVW